MSQSRTFEGRTIEEALRNAATELGPDVEVVDASKERRGGVLGFFAKERFVVTAHHHEPKPSASEADFGDLLLQMADEISDTYETSLVEPADDAQAAIEARARRAIAAAGPNRPEPGSIGVIDLREGRRVTSTHPTSRPAPGGGFSFGGGERPSQLRRRLEPTTQHPTPASGGAHVIPGAVPETRDTAPDWSVAALRRLGVPESILATVDDFGPVSDIEWLHAIAIAIGRLLPEHASDHLNTLVGEGRGSAIDLIRGLEMGLLPGYMVIEGQQVRATPDELALSIRQCLR